MKIKIFTLCWLLVAVAVFSGCAKLDDVSVCKTNGGRQVEYYLHKKDSNNTVVFENGLGGNMDWWAKVLPEIEKNATVFAYNRPEYGKSDTASTPRDGEHVVSELRILLAEKGLKPPYILVGHSLGGLYMQYYARRYPDEVKALILVDSTHPEQFKGVGSVENWPGWVSFGFKMTLNESQKEEFRLINKTGEEVLALPAPSGKTVIILSASKPLQEKSPLADYANEKRKDMANLYPGSKQIWVNSGHGIPLEKPEAVILAIQEGIESK